MDEDKKLFDDNKKLSVDEEQNRLLQLMIKRQERDIVLSRITAYAECAMLLVLIIVFALLVPKFLTAVTQVEEAMDEVHVLTEDAEEALTQIVALVEDVDSVVKENEEEIGEAIENFNSVDFEGLNETVSNIEKIVSDLEGVLSRLEEVLGPVKGFLKGTG